MMARKFKDTVSILGISILAILVVSCIASYFYHMGYHDGIANFLDWLRGATSQPPATSSNGVVN